jgi:hypothetical protein
VILKLSGLDVFSSNTIGALPNTGHNIPILVKKSRSFSLAHIIRLEGHGVVTRMTVKA